MPLRSLSTRFGKHPLADRDDQAGRFEDGNEVVGLDHSPLRVTPPQEGLYADECSGREIDSGLIEEKELPILQSLMQIDFDGPVVVDGFLHRRGKGYGTVLATGLGSIEGNVGVSQELTGLRPVALCDADACRDLQEERHWPKSKRG